jgi:opacity protein-like surface antigen
MKTLLLAAVAAISVSSAAHAYDLTCNVTDTVGNHLTYAFGINTHNADGSFGGTLVETGFEKNGRMVISERGARPVWIYNGANASTFSLWSREAPGWRIAVNGFSAELWHNNRFAGSGACVKQEGATDVADQGL